MNALRLFLLGCVSMLATAALAADSLPVARMGDAVDQAFGLALPDPYRWMEGEKNVEFDAWIAAYGAYGRKQLDALPRLEFWRTRLKAASSAVTLNRLQQPMGGRIFFLRLQAGKEGVLMVKERNGSERVLFDPAAGQSEKGTAAVTIFSPSPDGKLIALNVQRGGAEITRVMVMDVGTAKPLPDAIDDVWGEFAVSWLPDGKGFTYTQLAPPDKRSKDDPLLDERARLHMLGTLPSDDPVLLARGLNDRVSLEPSEFPFVVVDAESPWALAVVGGARPQSRLCVVERTEALKPSAPWNCIVGYDDNVQNFALQGSHLYLDTKVGAANGKVLAIDLTKQSPSVAGALLLIPESRDGVVTGLVSARDALYVRRMKGGIDGIVRVGHDEAAAKPLTMPFPGAAYQIATDPRADGLVFTLQGWTRPRTAYRYDPASRKLDDLKLGGNSPADYSSIVAVETTARSADGTMVPISILHRKDAPRNRGNRAILEGYGSYGISLQPNFDPLVLEWVMAGNIYAVAHVRGGGENGDAWRIGGSKLDKHKSVEDFIGCAQMLVASGWTTPSRITALGGSAGGILVGGAITRAPGGFGAAVIQAGELNVTRLSAAKNGANQFAELGDPSTAEGLKSLAGMDPYQHIKQGAKYPAVMLIVGLNDNRVAPWASGKFGARLMAASSSGKPVWYRTDSDMGHFSVAMGARALEHADTYAFAEAMTP
jgi:prolyl oligopeptidase